MVNLNANSPNNKRRKSVGGGELAPTTPKKAKIEETKTPNKNKPTPGKGNKTPAKNNASPGKKPNATPVAKQNGKSPVANNKTPGKNAGGKTPKATPAKNNSPVKNEQKSPKKRGNSESDGESPSKKPKMFSGTTELNNGEQAVKAETKKANKIKPKKEKKEKKEAQGGPVAAKKKKKGLVFHVIERVAKGEGQTVLEAIDKKIAELNTRGELTKSAKRRLRILMKWKQTAEGNPPKPQTMASKKAERVKRDAANKQEKGKQNQKKEVKGKQQQVKKETAAKAAPKKEEEDSDEAEEEEEESDYEIEGVVKPDKVSKTKQKTSDDEDSEDDDDEDDDDDDEEDSDEDEEQSPAPKQQKGKKNKQPDLQDLKANDIVKNGQKRYVLFVGNLPFDATKEEITEHFSKVGKIRHVRIPTEKDTQKPRGFAYVELENEESYQKGLSMHHTQLKGRRINVLYTEGGKKKGEEQKKQVKAKNFKLHAMRKEGQLAGSVKDSQKRAARRNKRAKLANGGDS